MKEFTTRAIFGLLYAAAVLSGIYFHPYGLLALMVIIYIIGIYETKFLLKADKDKILYQGAAAIGVLLLWAHLSFLQVYQDFLLPLIIFLILALTLHHLFSKGSENNVDRLPRLIFAALYLFIPTSLAFSISIAHGDYQPELLISIFLVLWANDTLAYISGMALGKHKLIPRLSPKKSIEGLVGGIIGALIMGYLISLFWNNLTLTQWLIFAVITAIGGTIGDLLESAMKRSAGVKDSSNLIPGHGGVLDRLDSFLLSVPIVYFYLRFFT